MSPIINRVHALNQLGNRLDDLINQPFSNPAFEETLSRSSQANGWFDRNHLILALQHIRPWLTTAALETWLARYDVKKLEAEKTGEIAVIMAGNLPAVNLHDVLCVFLSGYRLRGKLSSQDPFLLPWLVSELSTIYPAAAEQLHFTEGLIRQPDAVIATGSNNSARYFEYYFGKYPHIIRKNRTSVAVLEGDETDAELDALGNDVFTFYGLGCRNVSKIYHPEGYDVTHMLRVWENRGEVIQHHKYNNNYEYHKAIFLVNQDVFLDNGIVMLKPSEKLHAPISVIFTQTYRDVRELNEMLDEQETEIQCRVGRNQPVTFGKTQEPGLADYPDGVDVMNFLLELT